MTTYFRWPPYIPHLSFPVSYPMNSVCCFVVLNKRAKTILRMCLSDTQSWSYCFLIKVMVMWQRRLSAIQSSSWVKFLKGRAYGREGNWVFCLDSAWAGTPQNTARLKTACEPLAMYFPWSIMLAFFKLCHDYQWDAYFSYRTFQHRWFCACLSWIRCQKQ